LKGCKLAVGKASMQSGMGFGIFMPTICLDGWMIWVSSQRGYLPFRLGLRVLLLGAPAGINASAFRVEKKGR
jgi:hypothetical protein